MTDERSRWYELLGLAPGASPEELKAAHRDLVKVWHPDRFAHDPRLQQKAQEKLKEVNEAFDALTSGRAPRREPPERSDATAPDESHLARARPSARSPRPRRGSVFAAAALCVAAFVAAGYVLRTRVGGAETPADKREAMQARTAPAESRPRAEAPAAAQRAREAKRPENEGARAASAPADPPSSRAAATTRPLPTVTVLIDPTTGLLATPACPVRSRTNYAAGSEPRRRCDAHRK